MERLGWVLLHTLWQGALVAVLLAGALWLLRAHGARLRYAVSVAALAGMLALPLITWNVLPPSDAASPAQTPVGPAQRMAPALAESAAPPASVMLRAGWRRAAAPYVPWLAVGWGFGVGVLGMRLLGGWVYTRRLRQTAVPVDGVWPRRVAALAEQMGVRRSVTVLQSDRAGSPMVVGWWKPAVLVPLGVLVHLPPRQVEALLTHELAHIRRHDVLVGWLQAVAETLLFYHPAAWWVARQVRTAREHCCDDLVVATGIDPLDYAHALTELADAQPGHSLAFAPAAQEGELLGRIRRLVGAPAPVTAWSQRLPLAGVALLVVALPLGLAACASQQATTSPSSIDPTEARADTRPDARPDPAAPAAPAADTVEHDTEVPVPPDSIQSVTVQRTDSSRTITIFTDSDTIRLDGVRPGGAPRAIIEQPASAWRVPPDSLREVIIQRLDSLKIGAAPPPSGVFRDVPDRPGPPVVRFDRGGWPDTIPMPGAPRPPLIELDSLPDAWFSDPERLQQWEDWADEWVRQWEQRTEAWEQRTEAWGRQAERWQQHAERMRQRADSLHRARMARQPERLREQTEQLRRHAERLEEQARELEREADRLEEQARELEREAERDTSGTGRP